MPDQVDWRSMERESSPGRAVGRLLRDQRLARELAIDDVAARLRIRSRYIEAIEQGRFDQLPGAAYIPAFLRAYANYIGLDADKVMTAYQLSGPVPIARPVTLPADFPLVEKRAPIGLAVLTVLLVIGAGYAVWHYLPRQQMIVSEKVPPVPDRMMATPAPAPQPAVEKPSPSPAQTQEANTPTSPAPAASTPAAPTSTASAPAPVAPAATPAAAAANEVWPAPKQETQAAAPAAPPAVVVTPPAPPPLMMPMPGIGQAQAAQAPAPAPAPVAQQEATAPPAAPAATLPMQSDTKVYARSNSWIELRGPAGDVLTQTYVRAGESYTVPAGIAYRIIDAR
ncbi:MAG: helix-turn-helix domain-containing protein [Reyranellales bacterium]